MMARLQWYMYQHKKTKKNKKKRSPSWTPPHEKTLWIRACGTVSLTEDWAQGDDSKQYAIFSDFDSSSKIGIGQPS